MNKQELTDLKAELEMVSYEELQELQKRLETLEFKFNELIDVLYQTNVCQNTILYSKVTMQ